MSFYLMPPFTQNPERFVGLSSPNTNGSEQHGPPPDWFNPRKVLEFSRDLPPTIIQGLWRQEEVLLLGGHAKSWKSWALMDLMFCIANGFPWLIWPTAAAGPVLCMDMELLPGEIRHRFELIQESYGCGTLDNIDALSLRGLCFGLSDFTNLSTLVEPRSYRAMSFDPTYRMLTGQRQSESDPAIVTELMNSALQIGTASQSGVGLLQHFPKGNQSNKRAIDAFSGTSIWGRAPDVCVTFREHQDQCCYTVGCDLRHWAPVESFVVQFDHPRFVLCPDKDPQNLKLEKKSGRPKTFTAEQLCLLIESDEYIAFSSLLRRAQAADVSQSTFNRRLKDAKISNFIASNPADSTYFLTSTYLAKFRP